MQPDPRRANSPHKQAVTASLPDREKAEDTIFSDTYRRNGRWNRVGRSMPKMRRKNQKKMKRRPVVRLLGRPGKPSPKLSGGSRRVATEIGEIVRKRAEAEAAI